MRWIVALVVAVAALGADATADAAPRRPKARAATPHKNPSKARPTPRKTRTPSASRAARAAAPKNAPEPPPPAAAAPPPAAAVAPPESTPAPAPSAVAPPIAPAPSPAAPDRVTEPPAPDLARVTITANPLALIIGRYGANLEVLVAPHHAVVVSGYMQTFSTPLLRTLAQGTGWVDATRPLPGGELGYRVYSSRAGAAGLFAGASFVLMPIAYPRLGASMKPEIVSYHAHGGALDVGVQAILRGGITLGGGVGVMALAYPRPENASLPDEIAAVAPPLPTFPAPRILPRLLLTAGYSF
ncbi:MAG: hypothetical protein KC657_38635 [Myxococcales bacterium]|nr:hypothetical protein [Myxococcales bacterium]